MVDDQGGLSKNQVSSVLVLKSEMQVELVVLWGDQGKGYAQKHLNHFPAHYVDRCHQLQLMVGQILIGCPVAYFAQLATNNLAPQAKKRCLPKDLLMYLASERMSGRDHGDLFVHLLLASLVQRKLHWI